MNLQSNTVAALSLWTYENSLEMDSHTENGFPYWKWISIPEMDSHINDFAPMVLTAF